MQMKSCNHTEYLFHFWSIYLLDQSILKKKKKPHTCSHTRAHTTNSRNVKEHEKFPLELFPLHCINKGGGGGLEFFLRLHFLWMLSLWNEALLRKSAAPLLSSFLSHFSFQTHQLSIAFSLSPLSLFHKRFPAESSWCLVLAAFPRLWGLSLEINGCLFSPVLSFYVWTDMASTILTHSAELFPFRCASLQIAEISRGPVSNCLSHLVFNLLKSGL